MKQYLMKNKKIFLTKYYTILVKNLYIKIYFKKFLVIYEWSQFFFIKRVCNSRSTYQIWCFKNTQDFFLKEYSICLEKQGICTALKNLEDTENLSKSHQTLLHIHWLIQSKFHHHKHRQHNFQCWLLYFLWKRIL